MGGASIVIGIKIRANMTQQTGKIRHLLYRPPAHHSEAQPWIANSWARPRET